MRQLIRKYSWTPACDIQFENTSVPPRATLNLKILLDSCVRQSIRKYSLTPTCDIQFENSPGHPFESHFSKGVSGLSPVFPIVVPLIPLVNSVNHVNSVNSFNSLNRLYFGATSISDGIFVVVIDY